MYVYLKKKKKHLYNNMNIKFSYFMVNACTPRLTLLLHFLAWMCCQLNLNEEGISIYSLSYLLHQCSIIISCLETLYACGRDGGMVVPSSFHLTIKKRKKERRKMQISWFDVGYTVKFWLYQMYIFDMQCIFYVFYFLSASSPSTKDSRLH